MGFESRNVADTLQLATLPFLLSVSTFCGPGFEAIVSYIIGWFEDIFAVVWAPPWSSGSVLDHRSLPPVFESRGEHI